MKWMLDDPRVDFASSTRAGCAAGISHLGIQVEDETGAAGVYDRLSCAGRPIIEAKATTCCYPKSDWRWDCRSAGRALGTVCGEGSLLP